MGGGLPHSHGRMERSEVQKVTRIFAALFLSLVTGFLAAGLVALIVSYMR